MRWCWAGGQGLWLMQEIREDLNQLYLVSAVGVAEMTADKYALAGVAVITTDLFVLGGVAEITTD